MRNFAYLFSTLTLLIAGCSRNDDNGSDLKKQENDYVVVAITGMISTCTVYLFNKDEIRKDSLVTQLFNIQNTIRGRKLSDADFQKGKFIFFNLPEEILDDPNEAYGCPNCADGGAINFIIRKNEKDKKMSLEWSPGNYPDYLKSYVEELKRVLSEI